MPRGADGTFGLLSPPMPLVAGTTARAEDVNTVLGDIASGLTGSAALNGSTAWAGTQNFNNNNLTGIANLTASGTVNAVLLVATNAQIGALASPLNANNQTIYDVGQLDVAGDTGISGSLGILGELTVGASASVGTTLAVGGAANFAGGIAVNAGAANFFAGLQVNAGRLVASGGATITGGLIVDGVFGNGINYAGIGGGAGGSIAFFWNAQTSMLATYVNGAYVGDLDPVLAPRLAALEARIAELEDQLAAVH